MPPQTEGESENKMSWIDWLIVIIPVGFVYYMGLYSRRYVRSVADFLSAGRVCGRYVINVGDIANALSIIGIVAMIEVNYKSGFGLTFWSNMLLPLSVFMGLTGFCQTLENGDVLAELQGPEDRILFLVSFMEHLRRIKIRKKTITSLDTCPDETLFRQL
jgi:hypothetical protein